ncbi:MAG: Ig-like domain-containing protein [Myxococcales bacterium]|nr:Ig-like domain-containing protein [Polyangiaceae bacterium]MDW8251305.1 Ig-like domain-containing protein [Myxococcales bacterium]
MVATSPSAEQTDVPRNAPIRIRFDRFLDPRSVIRQSVRVTGGTLNPDGTPVASEEFFEPLYDLVERVAVYRLPENRTWAPGVRYTVTLFRPGEREGAGFRAWDGAPLETTITFAFTASSDPPPTVAPPPRAKYCSYRSEFPVSAPDGSTSNLSCTLLGGGQLLQQSCGYGNCHGVDLPGGPAQGLNLSSFEAMRSSAFYQIAHQTLTGPTHTAEANPNRFGASMPLIEPGQPGNSYLLYKILISPDLWDRPGRGEPSELPAQPVGGELRPSVEEIMRLRETFVLGAPMPLNASITLAQVRAIQDWIAQGAEGPQAPCTPVPTTCGDGGAGGAGGAGGSGGSGGTGGQTGVSYGAEVQPILTEKCAPCHTSGSGSGQLNVTSYHDTQKDAYYCNGKTKGACVLTRVQDGTMPQSQGCTGDPTQDAAKPGCLTADEQAKLQAWIDGGQQP